MNHLVHASHCVNVWLALKGRKLIDWRWGEVGQFDFIQFNVMIQPR